MHSINRNKRIVHNTVCNCALIEVAFRQHNNWLCRVLTPHSTQWQVISDTFSGQSVVLLPTNKLTTTKNKYRQRTWTIVIIIPDPWETTFLYQRISVATQRFNAVCLVTESDLAVHPCPPSCAVWRLTYSAALTTLTNSVYCSHTPSKIAICKKTWNIGALWSLFLKKKLPTVVLINIRNVSAICILCTFMFMLL